MQLGNFIDLFSALHVSGPSSGALDVELQHMVFCTEFVDGWWSWEPLCRSCVWCGRCRATIISFYNTSYLVNFVFLKYAISLLLGMYFACYKLLFVMCQFAWTLNANIIRITGLFTVL